MVVRMVVGFPLRDAGGTLGAGYSRIGDMETVFGKIT
jgi:hypothetical protein